MVRATIHGCKTHGLHVCHVPMRGCVPGRAMHRSLAGCHRRLGRCRVSGYRRLSSVTRAETARAVASETATAQTVATTAKPRVPATGEAAARVAAAPAATTTASVTAASAAASTVAASTATTAPSARTTSASATATAPRRGSASGQRHGKSHKDCEQSRIRFHDALSSTLRSGERRRGVFR